MQKTMENGGQGSICSTSSIPSNTNVTNVAGLHPRISTTSRIAEMCKVTDHLYITSSRGLSAYDIETNGIHHVVNATLETPLIRLPGVECTRISVNDVPTENIYRFFDQFADKVNGHAMNNEKVLVHCVAGVSRSASFVLAYLMKYQKMPLKDAYKYLHARRPVVRPNTSFFQQLIEYERNLFGLNTVTMAKIKTFDEQEIEVPDLYANEYKKMALLEIVVRRRNKIIAKKANAELK
jgi:atypical dual specificity phosphatase